MVVTVLKMILAFHLSNVIKHVTFMKDSVNV